MKQDLVLFLLGLGTLVCGFLVGWYGMSLLFNK